MKAHIRHYQSGDLDKYSRVYLDSEEFRREARWLSPRAFSEFLFSPRCRPEKDVWVAANGQQIIGLGYLTPEPEIDRVILRGIVHPQYRRMGIGRDLLDQAMKRTTDLKISVVQSDVGRRNNSASGFLEANHFRKVRVFHEMRLLMKDTAGEISAPEDIELGGLKQGEEGLLTEIQNLCFNGSWGYHPNERVEVEYNLSLQKGSHEDVLLAKIKNRPVGFCWLMIDPETSTTHGPGRGRIHMMGVVPDYCGTGIGRKLVISGLLHLKEKGITIVDLTVDSENRAAFNLYTSIGFKLNSDTDWYERSLSS